MSSYKPDFSLIECNGGASDVVDVADVGGIGGVSMLQEEECFPSMFHDSFDIEPSMPMHVVFCQSYMQILQSFNHFAQ